MSALNPLVFATMYCVASFAAGAREVAPLSGSPGPGVPPLWRVSTLPKLPRHTSYEVVDTDCQRAVRASAEGSYANVVHPLNVDSAETPILRWSCRADQFLADCDHEQGSWFAERRDLRPDFARAFGAEAQSGVPRISAVAFATDADNTRGRALAYFGDITLDAP